MKLFKNIWFKCISCLLIIAIVSGGLLAILSSLLYVSPEERTSRALSKIYDDVSAESSGTASTENNQIILSNEDIILDVDSDDTAKNTAIEKKEYGKITKMLKVDLNKNDNSYDIVYQAIGYNGYKGGTITMWVTVKYEDEKPIKIEKVLIEGNTKQTLMSKLTADFLNGFTLEDVTEDYKSGKLFTSDATNTSDIKNVVSGATMSANACCNAVNCVTEHVWGGNN